MEVFTTISGMKAEARFVHWVPGPSWGSFNYFFLPFFLFLNKKCVTGAVSDPLLSKHGPCSQVARIMMWEVHKQPCAVQTCTLHRWPHQIMEHLLCGGVPACNDGRQTRKPDPTRGFGKEAFLRQVELSAEE